MKKCNVCLQEKENHLYDKYRSTCRKCRNKKSTSSWLSKPGNIEKRREYQREYQKKHRMNNEYYKIYCECLWEIKNKIKSKKDNNLKQHLEKLFIDDMNWENYGEYWEVDHIISATKMAKLGYTIDEINKLDNLRPLKIKENRERNKKNVSEYFNNVYKNKEKDKEYQKEYHKNYRKKYYEKNKEKIKEKNLSYYYKKKEKNPPLLK